MYNGIFSYSNQATQAYTWDLGIYAGEYNCPANAAYSYTSRAVIVSGEGL